MKTPNESLVAVIFCRVLGHGLLASNVFRIFREQWVNHVTHIPFSGDKLNFSHSHDQCLPAIAEVSLTFNDVIATGPLKA